MNNERDQFRGWALSGARQFFPVMMVVCLAMILLAPSMRIWAGITLIALALVYVVLEQALATYGLGAATGARSESRPKASDPDFWDSAASGVVDIGKRLKTLRQVTYRPDAGWMRTRAARREMREISAACRPYYERMMLAERSVYTILNAAPISGVKPKDMMKQVQRLSQQIAVLVEQIQVADRLLTMYEAGSDEAAMVAQARARLIRRADRAMQVLEGVPARLLQLATATSTRGLSRLRDELDGVNTTLEGKAEAYEAMVQPLTYLEEAQSRLRKGR